MTALKDLIANGSLSARRRIRPAVGPGGRAERR